MKVLTLFFFTLFSLYIVTTSGCSRDMILTSNNSAGLLNRLGVYVLSEGTSTPNQSALSFLSYADGSFNNNITFPSPLGLFPGGIIEHSGYIYVTEQGNPGGTGRIYQMDTAGFMHSSLNFGINPYGIAAVNGKAYCTCGPDSSVRVINLNTMTEIKKIKVGIFPQEITAVGTKIFVCNTQIIEGGLDSTVSVIDQSTDNQIAKIKIGRTPSAVSAARDGSILVASSVYGGTIYKLSSFNYAKIDSFSVGAASISNIHIDYNSDDAYFVVNNYSIVRLNLTTKTKTTVISSAPTNNIVYIYGYSYDWKSQKHYVADAKDFVSNGVLYRFSSTGALESAYQTGVKPLRILIRN